MEATDLELVKATARGDGAAFHKLVDRFADDLFRLARSLSQSSADAEDICQETFAAVLEASKRFDGRSSVKTWLTRIAIRRAAKHWGKSRFMRETVRLDAPGGGAAIDGSSNRMSVESTSTEVIHRLDVLEILATLGPEHREVLTLREMQGLSYDEIARVLGIPRGTVESRLHRAREQMRQKLKGYV